MLIISLLNIFLIMYKKFNLKKEFVVYIIIIIILYNNTFL